MTWKDFAAFVGIDWADEEHAVCVMDAGSQKAELTSLDQEPEAIRQWVAKLQERFPQQKIAVCLEQKRGALMYALMQFDCLVLFPINPKQLARFREASIPPCPKATRAMPKPWPSCWPSTVTTYGLGNLMMNRHARFACWVKTEGLSSISERD